MKFFMSVIGIALFALNSSLLTLTVHAKELHIPEYSGRPEDEHPILAPCSRFVDRYETLGFRDNYIEDWPEMYHDQVDRVIEEYLESPKVQCDAEDYEAFMPPGPELLDLAASLPTWNDPDVPLSEYDISRVLLEYLRIYECALMEFEAFREFDTSMEEFDRKPEITFLFFSDVMEGSLKRAWIINKERAIARKTLHRVLTLIGTFGRLRPLEAELECTQRLSIDIRNIAALTAETSACLPRVWNAKDALRDFKEEDQ